MARPVCAPGHPGRGCLGFRFTPPGLPGIAGSQRLAPFTFVAVFSLRHDSQNKRFPLQAFQAWRARRETCENRKIRNLRKKLGGAIARNAGRALGARAGRREKGLEKNRREPERARSTRGGKARGRADRSPTGASMQRRRRGGRPVGLLEKTIESSPKTRG